MLYVYELFRICYCPKLENKHILRWIQWFTANRTKHDDIENNFVVLGYFCARLGTYEELNFKNLTMKCTIAHSEGKCFRAKVFQIQYNMVHNVSPEGEHLVSFVMVL